MSGKRPAGPDFGSGQGIVFKIPKLEEPEVSEQATSELYRAGMESIFEFHQPAPIVPHDPVPLGPQHLAPHGPLLPRHPAPLATPPGPIGPSQPPPPSFGQFPPVFFQTNQNVSVGLHQPTPHGPVPMAPFGSQQPDWRVLLEGLHIQNVQLHARISELEKVLKRKNHESTKILQDMKSHYEGICGAHQGIRNQADRIAALEGKINMMENTTDQRLDVPEL